MLHSEKLREILGDKKPAGMKIMIDSLVPIAAGLGSSSAFCVCAAVTTMHANGLISHVDK